MFLEKNFVFIESFFSELLEADFRAAFDGFWRVVQPRKGEKPNQSLF